MNIYDFLSPSFDEIEKKLDNIITDRLDNLSMLDIATGSGKHLKPFFKKGISEITVIDRYHIDSNIFKEKYPDSNMIVITADIFEYNFTKKYDIVTIFDNSLQIFRTFEEQYKIIKLMSSVLKDDGKCIIQISPITEKDILRYSGEYKHIDNSELYVNISVNMFEQLITYRYMQGNENKSIESRFILKKEIQDMIFGSGMYIYREETIGNDKGQLSNFYFLKKTQK